MAGFQGFGPQALGFLKALGFHQDRLWFQENRALYESDVREPTLLLVEALTERFKAERIPLLGGKKTMFRINRDVRFSNDKRPYQTHASAVLTPTGDKEGIGLVYFHVQPSDHAVWEGPSGSFVAAGFHALDPQRLNALRTSIMREPKAFLAMERKLAKAGLSLDTGSQLTRMPRGFEDQKDGPVAHAIRLRNFTVEEPLDEGLITTPAMADAIVAFTCRARPLLDYGWKVLGGA